MTIGLTMTGKFKTKKETDKAMLKKLVGLYEYINYSVAEYFLEEPLPEIFIKPLSHIFSTRCMNGYPDFHSSQLKM